MASKLCRILLMFLLFSKGYPKLTITQYEDCEQGNYKTISFKTTFIGNLINLTIANLIPVGDNAGIKFKIELGKGGTFRHLTTLGHKNACLFAKTILGSLWVDVTKALGFTSSTCPITQLGTHTAINYKLDTSKINLGMLGKGDAKIRQWIYLHKGGENISCAVGAGFIS